MGAQWLSDRVLDSKPRGRGFKSHRRLCVVSLSKNINPSLVLVQPRKTLPFITERLLMGHKESNQTNYFLNTLWRGFPFRFLGKLQKHLISHLIFFAEFISLHMVHFVILKHIIEDFKKIYLYTWYIRPSFFNWKLWCFFLVFKDNECCATYWKHINDTLGLFTPW